jgi:hypothetical protein
VHAARALLELGALVGVRDGAGATALSTFLALKGATPLSTRRVRVQGSDSVPVRIAAIARTLERSSRVSPVVSGAEDSDQEQALLLGDLMDEDSPWGGIGEFCMNEDLADVIVRGTDESDTCFRAHRVVLVARSPLFRAMLRGRFREASTQEVRFSFGEAPLGALLLFLYTGCVPRLSVPDALQLHDLSRMHRLEELSLLVERMLAWSIDLANVGELWRQASARDMRSLRCAIVNYFVLDDTLDRIDDFGDCGPFAEILFAILFDIDSLKDFSRENRARNASWPRVGSENDAGNEDAETDSSGGQLASLEADLTRTIDTIMATHFVPGTVTP